MVRGPPAAGNGRKSGPSLSGPGGDLGKASNQKNYGFGKLYHLNKKELETFAQ